MANDVFANGRDVSCKSAEGKSICSFPDVCLSPPSPPAGPVPIPYPNTGMATDTGQGSKTVLVGGQEVMLKDYSSFQKSTGDEAATKSLGMGVVTHQITGKVYFTSWSMDIVIEGENAVRHLDVMTHNHASVPGNTPTWPYIDQNAIDPSHPCAEDHKKERDACGPLEEKYGTGKVKIEETQKKVCADTPEAKKCQEARKCMLTPYKPDRCCDGQTGHHLVEVHGFCESGDRDSPMPPFDGSNGKTAYDQNKAPCVCASSPNSNWEAEHGDLHSVQGIKENYAVQTAAGRNPPRDPGRAWNYGEARQAGVDAHAATYPNQCKEGCIAAQLDAYHKDEVGVSDSSMLRTGLYGFGNQAVDQLKRGVQLIKALMEKRIGQMVGGAL